MSRNILAYLRWLTIMVHDEDERKDLTVERYPQGGAKVLNSDGEVMLDATLIGNAWKVHADNGAYDETYPLSTSGTWSPEQIGGFKLIEQVLRQL